jgi:HEAT repeat protein
MRLDNAGRISFLNAHIADNSTLLLEDFLIEALHQEHHPIAIWFLIKGLGILRASSSIRLILGVCKSPEVDFGHTSLHSICAWSLGRIGKAAYEAVADLLTEFDPETRRCGVDCLGEIRDPRSIALLSKALENDEYMVQVWAGLSLAKLGEASLPVLREVARTNRGVIPVIAADAISKIEHNVIPISAS